MAIASAAMLRLPNVDPGVLITGRATGRSSRCWSSPIAATAPVATVVASSARCRTSGTSAITLAPHASPKRDAASAQGRHGVGRAGGPRGGGDPREARSAEDEERTRRATERVQRGRPAVARWRPKATRPSAAAISNAANFGTRKGACSEAENARRTDEDTSDSGDRREPDGRSAHVPTRSTSGRRARGSEPSRSFVWSPPLASGVPVRARSDSRRAAKRSMTRRR